MDPFTIAASVAKVTTTCLATGKMIYDITSKYKDAPRNIVAISSEIAVISASMSQIQTIILSKQNPEQLLRSRPELAATLDTSLTGCLVLFSCLEEEIRHVLTHMRGHHDLSWKGKMRTVWKQETFQELLDGMRGQQLAINTLIQLLQMDSLVEITALLRQKAPELKQTAEKTRSIRRSYPSLKIAESIYSQADRRSVYTASMLTSSEMEFEFDDIIVNSAAYRRAMAAAKRTASPSHAKTHESLEGDLIDFSNDDTLHPVSANNASQDARAIVEDLHGLQFATSMDEPSFSAAVDSSVYDMEVATPLDTSPMVTATKAHHQRHRAEESRQAVDGPQDEADPPGPAIAVSSGLVDSSPYRVGGLQRRAHRNEARLGDYILGQTLADCEETTVKICWKLNSPIRSVVKLIRKQSTHPSHVYHQLFLLLDLKHRNVIELREFLETGSHFAFVFKYASGSTLGEYLYAHRYLDDSSGRRIFAQLLLGIDYLHKNGVLHYGLHLDNIMLDKDRKITIIGFGFAKSIYETTDQHKDDYDPSASNANPQKHSLPRLGLRGIDCAYYTAPELLSSDPVVDGRKADIWSCGVVLFAILSELLPYRNTPLRSKIESLEDLNNLYKDIFSMRLTFPEWVTPQARDLIRRILVPDPSRRANLSEVSLHSWLDGYSHLMGRLRDDGVS